MRRAIVSLVLAVTLLIIPFSSIAGEYSSRTDEELYATLNQIRAELVSRQQNRKMIISEADGIAIYCDNIELDNFFDDDCDMKISITAVSTGNKPLGILFDSICINGWQIDPVELVELDAGLTAKKFMLLLGIGKKAGIKSTNDIQEIVFVSHCYDPQTRESLSGSISKTLLYP